MSEESSFDVIVVGGGFVGTTLGLALAGAGVRCAVVEASNKVAGVAEPRPIALAEGSRRILQGLGLWDCIGEGVTPIRTIHVSDRGRFGFARLHAADYGVDALGYVSDAEAIAACLDPALARDSAPALFRPYGMQFLEVSDECARVGCIGGEQGDRPVQLRARLVIAADGGQSSARALAGIGARKRDWRQSAITANLKTRLDHGNVAFERFTGSGPIALLPLARQQVGLVWTMPHDQADRIMALSDSDFLLAVRQAFGSRLGSFSRTGPRTRHPLFSLRSSSPIKPRFALVGNAANHLHPVAGQGLNLGLRDAAALAETVVDAIRSGEDPGAITTLRRYADRRRGDQRATSSFTSGVVRLFSNNFLPAAAARDAGLIGLDSFGFLKRILARHAMGLAGHSSRLARGLPL